MVRTCSKNGRGEITKRSYEMEPPQRRRKLGRPKLTWAEGIREMMGEKGLMEEDWNDRGQLEEEDNIIVKWGQGCVGKKCTAC
jgi:hypothetical protein